MKQTRLYTDETRTKLKADLMNKYGTIGRALNEMNIPRTTLRDYLNGKTRFIKDTTREVIYRATGFEYLSKPLEQTEIKPSKVKIGNKLELQLRNAQTSLDNIRSVIMNSDLSEEAKAEARESLIFTDKQRARRASNLFYAFVKEIHDFPEGARKRFTKLIPEDHAGYLISLVNYVYNPDKFKSWVGKAGFPLRKG
jgi:hypothetical protein